MSTAYVLQNFSTGRTFQDTGWLLSDPLDETPSLIRAVYKKKRLDCEDPDRGL